MRIVKSHSQTLEHNVISFPFSQSILPFFSRKTSSGRFIPEIDGLRFISIGLVVLMHLGFSLNKESHTPYVATLFSDWFARVANQGFYGVHLFFVISGFILSIPFAAHHLKGANPVSLKQYFLRRVTRLEPPYFLAITFFFILKVLIGDSGLGFSELLTHYFASLFYLHNLIYLETSYILSVAWSLEIEIQFYLLAPLLAYLFSIPSAWLRRTVIAVIALLAIIVQFLFIPGNSIFQFSIANYIQYFLMGFILADIYLSDWNEKPISHWSWDLLPPTILIVILSNWIPNPYWEFIFPLLVLLLFFAVFKSVKIRKIIVNPWITTIGGMCYTIYLMHAPIIKLIGKGIDKIGFTGHFPVDFLIISVAAIPIILVTSFAFFALIERPCMERNWHKNLYHKIWRGSSFNTNEFITEKTPNR